MLVAVIPTSSHSSCSEQKLLLFLFCKWICNMGWVLSKHCHEPQTITQLMTEMLKMEPKKLHFVRTSLLESVGPHTVWSAQIQRLRHANSRSYLILSTSNNKKKQDKVSDNGSLNKGNFYRTYPEGPPLHERIRTHQQQ